MLDILKTSAVLLCLATTIPSAAATIADAKGDYLATYTGTRLAELDVLSFSVAYDYGQSEFVLGAKVAGRIHAEGGIYVIGVNTGAGALAPFGAIGAPNVRFDQVVIVQLGKGSVTGVSGGALAANAVTLNNDVFTVRVPSSFLVSTGFSLGDYGFNLWPRIGLGGGNGQIADFAPNDGTTSAGAIPEPGVWAMLLSGFAAVGMASRRRRKTQVAA